jgi:hypothetical protein
LVVFVFCAIAAAGVANAQAPRKPARPAQAAADSTTARVKPRPASSGRVRTLDAITIEGEIAVPQVLFITSRDVRRFRDGLGSTYRLSAVDLSRSMHVPTRMRVVPRTDVNKEEGR